MSDPKRYKLRPIFLDYIQVKSVSKDQIDAMGNESAYSHKDGDLVKYEDYARLKAEVERLTKAGDAMVPFFPETGRIANAWHAAKHAAKKGGQP